VVFGILSEFVHYKKQRKRNHHRTQVNQASGDKHMSGSGIGFNDHSDNEADERSNTKQNKNTFAK